MPFSKITYKYRHLSAFKVGKNGTIFSLSPLHEPMMRYVHFRFAITLITLCNCAAFLSNCFPSKNALCSKRINCRTRAICNKEIKKDFPIFSAGSRNLIYLDNAASSQKPHCVLEVMDSFYRNRYSNVHRSGHMLGRQATDDFENARNEVSKFIGAARPEEVVFTSGATDAINLVANTWALEHSKKGDEIILSVAEHHSNIVPWQMLAKKVGCLIKFVQLDETGRFDIDHFKSLLSSRTRIVSLAHISNVLGVVNPISEMTSLAHDVGAKVLVDACQSLPHIPVNVQILKCDWLVGSSHKMCGPTGVGVLWGRYDLLLESPPWKGGGEMVDKVYLTHSTYAPPPLRFESGTPPIVEAIGFGEACKYLTKIGMQNIAKYETELAVELWDKLSNLGLELYGPSPAVCTASSPESRRIPLVCFNHQSMHSSDLACFLDQQGFALRSGHHCAQPLHRSLKITTSIRASLHFHNEKHDIDKLVLAIQNSAHFLSNI